MRSGAPGLDKPLRTCLRYLAGTETRQKEAPMKRMDVAISAAAKLALFRNRELELTESHFDALVDTLVELLGDARDETWRLRKDTELSKE